MMVEEVETYLALRRSLGYDLNDAARILRAFANYCADRGMNYVHAQTAQDWIGLSPSPGQRSKRLHVVRTFATHVRAEDPRHEVPLDGTLPYRRARLAPYIYTHEEIVCLIDAALGHLRPRWHAHTYATLLGLLAATGMRVSEVVALRISDVTDDGLIVRQTKFKKSRLLPLHDTTTAAIDRYLQRRHKMVAYTDNLFVTPQGQPLSVHLLRAKFAILRRVTGMLRGSGKRNPRLHDLRHTFAVRVLEQAPYDRGRITEHILALSTYLGHAHVSDTYWYFEATPQLLLSVSKRCEEYIKEVRR